LPSGSFLLETRKGMMGGELWPPTEAPASPHASLLLDAYSIRAAIQFYAAMNSNTLPGPRDWKSALARANNSSPSRYNQLVYVFAGGALPTDATKLKALVIGYVPGPGGRAVVYGNFKVRWVAKK